MQHEPSRLLGQVVLALDLASCNPVLGRAHLEDHEQPLADRDLGAVEDRARQSRELLSAVSALPDTALAHGAGAGLPGGPVARLEEVVLADRSAVRADRLA